MSPITRVGKTALAATTGREKRGFHEQPKAFWQTEGTSHHESQRLFKTEVSPFPEGARQSSTRLRGSHLKATATEPLRLQDDTHPERGNHRVQTLATLGQELARGSNRHTRQFGASLHHGERANSDISSRQRQTKAERVSHEGEIRTAFF